MLPEDHGRALNALANLCWRGGSAERGRPIAELALRVNREAGSVRGIAWSFGNLGMISHLRHEHELAVERLAESVCWARRGGRLALLSLSLTYFGRTLLWLNGPYDQRVSDALDESLALAEAAQSRYARGGALATLGDLRWAQGGVAGAVQLWRASLGLHAELADRRGIAGSLERLGLVLATSDQLEAAAWVFGAAAAQHTRLSMEVRYDGEPDHAHFAGVTRRNFPEAFDVPWSAGQEATLEEAVAYALDRTRELPGLGRSLPSEAQEQYEFPGGVSLPRPRVTRAS